MTTTLMDLNDVIIQHDLRGLERALQWATRHQVSHALEQAMRGNFHDGILMALAKIEQMYDPHERRQLMENLMALSAQHSDLKSIKILETQCPGSRTCWADSLTCALEGGNVEVAQYVYDEKSSPNLPLPTRSGLYRAVQKNHINVVRWGIQHNVDMNVVEMAITNRSMDNEMADLLYDHATPAEREEVAIILLDRELTAENSRWLYRHHVEEARNDLAHQVGGEYAASTASARKKI